MVEYSLIISKNRFLALSTNSEPEKFVDSKTFCSRSYFPSNCRRSISSAIIFSTYFVSSSFNSTSPKMLYSEKKSFLDKIRSRTPTSVRKPFFPTQIPEICFSLTNSSNIGIMIFSDTLKVELKVLILISLWV